VQTGCQGKFVRVFATNIKSQEKKKLISDLISQKVIHLPPRQKQIR